MKKLSALALVLLSGAGAANSQEAFKHLSIGLEAATTGSDSPPLSGIGFRQEYSQYPRRFPI